MAKQQRRSNKTKVKPVSPALHSEVIQTRVSPTLLKRIRDAAEQETISVAAYMRRMLKTYTPGGA